MGTFTFAYLFKKLWEHRIVYGLGIPLVGWYGTRFQFLPPVIAFALAGACWDSAGTHKASMMKGQSVMFSHKRDRMPPGQDPWRW